MAASTRRLFNRDSPVPESMDMEMPLKGRHQRLNSNGQNSVKSSGTFAPKFIQEELRKTNTEPVHHIEGENDFSGKKYVWVKDQSNAFAKGWIVSGEGQSRLLVALEDGRQLEVDADEVDRVNPAKFDRVDDMAELTYLNEPSIVHNLHMRYQADLIYTYSGLFLVAVNPYRQLPIYTQEYINNYRGRAREDTKPHIYAIADHAHRSLCQDGVNQSILVTGESGAGKTENTKKVIQYIAVVAKPKTTNSAASKEDLSSRILQANPILEAFGNAQTVKNNNSSRFGKFIRIEISRSGEIQSANIDWYLLEKSRVVKQNSAERNYHVFYQMINGASRQLKSALLMDECTTQDFNYTKEGNEFIPGVSDLAEWQTLCEAFRIVQFADEEQRAVFKTLAAILHLGNVTVQQESRRADQASLSDGAEVHIRKACKLLGIDAAHFTKGLLRPIVKAGREMVEKTQTPEQVRSSLDALSKSMYERTFGDLVTKINRKLNRDSGFSDDSQFVGVLDIAGFEIFDTNSFEQLCINYTNEKLQQFFNHHMFVLEQEEYSREQIQWDFIDFGKDLQPTIDLIELTNPIGIFSCLDEDSVMPKATDKTFTEKLHGLWDKKTPKYQATRLKQGFVLTHYAAAVEYSTEGWLEKNKDPINENVASLLASSSDNHISNLFQEYQSNGDDFDNSKTRVKRGLFRTVAQRHKEQLTDLMRQLHSTQPHFVRCILPNHKKKAKDFETALVLDQLRCNGVLEGIRIARTGFPNRLPFSEFRQRYEVLAPRSQSRSTDAKSAAIAVLESLELEPAVYRVGLTKVFFRAGILAELEERRDALIQTIITKFQAQARGQKQRRLAYKTLYRAEATAIVAQNFHAYLRIVQDPWWQLFVRIRPMLGATRTANELKRKDQEIVHLQNKLKSDQNEHRRLEDERRRAENEIAKVQKILESERSLALDKEEIFSRLQQRESDLTEKLAGALEDQDDLEKQLDELIAAKQTAETQASRARSQVEQAVELVQKLEADKKQLLANIADLEHQLETRANAKEIESEQVANLEHEKRVLESQLKLQTRKTTDLETRLIHSNDGLEKELLDLKKTNTFLERQHASVLQQHETVQRELSGLAATSTGFEEMLRTKEAEINLLKSAEKNRVNTEQAARSERDALQRRLDDNTRTLQAAKAELEALRPQRQQLERQLAEARQLLDAKMSADSQSHKNVELLEGQLEDVKRELYDARAEWSRERQSRDDVQLLSKHEVSQLKDEHARLNEAKIEIEKEMYLQQDSLRRAVEGRAAAESQQRSLQTELSSLRERYNKLEQQHFSASAEAERAIARQASERQSQLREDLRDTEAKLQSALADKAQLLQELQYFKEEIANVQHFTNNKDEAKERLERELVAIKGRLTASENDNKVLLNKIQLKNLDIARSNSRAGESQKIKVAQLQAGKQKAESEHRSIFNELSDAQLKIASLEKQKEKLALALEDSKLEKNREQGQTRASEQSLQTLSSKIAETNTKLETERALRIQDQAKYRQVEQTLGNVQEELDQSRKHLILLQKVFDPKSGSGEISWKNIQPSLGKSVNLAGEIEKLRAELEQRTQQLHNAQHQAQASRLQHAAEISQLEAQHNQSKRSILDELNQNEVTKTRPLVQSRKVSGQKANWRHSTPVRELSDDKENDHLTLSSKSNLSRALFEETEAELEQMRQTVQTLQSENRNLQNQLSRSTSSPADPSAGRLRKLELENGRLHSNLDASARQLATLEARVQRGELSLRDVQTNSHEELYELLNRQETARKSISRAHDNTVTELADAKRAFDALKQAKNSLEAESQNLRARNAELESFAGQSGDERGQLLQEITDLQIKADTEGAKALDAMTSLTTYKARADEYFSKLEAAEVAVLKAHRAEQFAKSQAKEAEQLAAHLSADQKRMEESTEDLKRRAQSAEEKVEDLHADLQAVTQAKKRLQHELEDYRAQRASDVEDKETSLEQTRRRFQGEFSNLNRELESERDKVVQARQESTHLRHELDDLRAKWDDEVLNSSTWAKEKARLEKTLQDLSSSREEAVNAHNDAQIKVVSLLAQIRTLRSSADDIAAERDGLAKDKRTLEARLTETHDRLEDLIQGKSSTAGDFAGMNKEVLDLKSKIAEKEDIADAAIDKMKRADAVALEAQKDVMAEREHNESLQRDKIALEKHLRELQGRIVELESKSITVASQDVRFLTSRVRELEKQLEKHESTNSLNAKEVRNTDRTVRDLQSQLERREKQNSQLVDDVSKAREKIERLLTNIDEMQADEAKTQLAARRAERELREERSEKLRLERELEGWKNLRVERGLLGSTAGRTSSISGSIRPPSSTSRGGVDPGFFSRAGSIDPKQQLRKLSTSKVLL